MNRYQKAILILSSLLIINSCTYNVAFFPYSSSLNAQIDEVVDTTYLSKLNTYTKNYYDVLKSNTGSSKIDPLVATGQQKMLVLPVAFPDYDLNELDKNKGDTAHIHIQNAFFGQSSATSWRSVTSFYHQSSYGKLQISGEVAPWYTLPEEYSVVALKQRVRSSSDKVSETGKIVNLALKAFVENGGDLDAFDQNDNDIVDSIYVIYAYPYETDASDNLFWAFVTSTNRNESGLSAQANLYAWSSYYYMNINWHNKPDAHTYIHETGHLLGLTDYYNTNYDDSYSPLGGFDMMDYTIGDHSGLSKMLLNWTYPYTMKKSGSVTLRPFGESGDLLLLKNNWNGSAVDEYLLLEYYTPTALNALDSRLNASFKLPRKSGVKVYHVDARTVYEIKNGNITEYEYVNDYTGTFSGTELLAHSNSSGRQNSAPKKNFVLYSLIEPNEITTISEVNGLASSSSLFTTGDDFNVTHFTSFSFNDTTLFNYQFTIGKMNKQEVTINVEVL